MSDRTTIACASCGNNYPISFARCPHCRAAEKVSVSIAEDDYEEGTNDHIYAQLDEIVTAVEAWAHHTERLIKRVKKLETAFLLMIGMFGGIISSIIVSSIFVFLKG